MKLKGVIIGSVKAGRYTHTQTHTHTHTHTQKGIIIGGINESISELGRGIRCSILTDKEILEFFLTEMLQDLSNWSIEFQVFGPWRRLITYFAVTVSNIDKNNWTHLKNWWQFERLVVASVKRDLWLAIYKVNSHQSECSSHQVKENYLAHGSGEQNKHISCGEQPHVRQFKYLPLFWNIFKHKPCLHNTN